MTKELYICGNQDVLIPVEDWEYFEKLGQLLLFRGGMWEMDRISLFGRSIPVLKHPACNEDGEIVVNYNWFDQADCEGCGLRCSIIEPDHRGRPQFVRSPRFYSSHVGYTQMQVCMYAAYQLQMYFQRKVSVICNGPSVSPYVVDGWLNYFLDTDFNFCEFCFWDLDEDNEIQELMKSDSILAYAQSWEQVKDILEMMAVQYGTSMTVENVNNYFLNCLQETDCERLMNLIQFINRSLENLWQRKDGELYLRDTVSMLQILHSEEIVKSKAVPQKDSIDVAKTAFMHELEAYTLKKISELLDVPYQQLFDQVFPNGRQMLDRHGYYELPEPVSTEVLFDVGNFLMLPYWSEEDFLIKASEEEKSLQHQIRELFATFAVSNNRNSRSEYDLYDAFILLSDLCDCYDIWIFDDLIDNILVNLQTPVIQNFLTLCQHMEFLPFYAAESQHNNIPQEEIEKHASISFSRTTLKKQKSRQPSQPPQPYRSLQYRSWLRSTPEFCQIRSHLQALFSAAYNSDLHMLFFGVSLFPTEKSPRSRPAR